MVEVWALSGGASQPWRLDSRNWRGGSPRGITGKIALASRVSRARQRLSILSSAALTLEKKVSRLMSAGTYLSRTNPGVDDTAGTDWIIKSYLVAAQSRPDYTGDRAVGVLRVN